MACHLHDSKYCKVLTMDCCDNGLLVLIVQTKFCSSFISQINYFRHDMTIEECVEIPTCNLGKIVHNEWF